MDSLSWLTDADLPAPVEGWTAEPLAGGAGEGLGVWRVPSATSELLNTT